MKITEAKRRIVEQLAAHLTVKTGLRHTMTDVLEMALELLAKKTLPRTEDPDETDVHRLQ